MEKLTHQEEEVMLEIWRQKEGTIKNFLSGMKEPRPPYTTIASVVKNLERKGYIIGQKYGTTYVYHAVVEENEFKKGFLARVVKNYFGSSYKEMVSFFADEQKISSQELEDVIRMIDEK